MSVATINCAVEEGGVRCSATIAVETVFLDASYICPRNPKTGKAHSRTSAVDAVNRINGDRAAREGRPFTPRSYDSIKDNVDKELRFQEHAFDKDLKRSARPVGTSHIHNQGSDIMTSEEIDRLGEFTIE